jgi:erythromycin esterase
VLQYVGRSARTPRPLALSGFDLQPGYFTRDMLLGELDAFAGRLGVRSEVTTPGSPLRELAENLMGFKYAPKGLRAPDAATRQRFSDDLEQLRSRLAAAATAATRADVDYWRQIVLSSLKSYGELKWYDVEHGPADPEWVSFNMRDKQNADNVMWLADQAYRGKKIIVWGATMHIVRNAGSIEATIDPKDPRRSYQGMVPMGAEVWRRAGSRMFSIGFTCYEGVNGIGATGDPQGFRSEIKSDQDPSIELEEILNAARFDYALLDFRNSSGAGAWLKAPIVSRPLANQGMRAVWPNVLDAMFFIRVMQPNEATR